MARPAHAAELQTSSSGLKYEDTKVGTGKEASKGTMIRQGFTACTCLQPRSLGCSTACSRQQAPVN